MYQMFRFQIDKFGWYRHRIGGLCYEKILFRRTSVGHVIRNANSV